MGQTHRAPPCRCTGSGETGQSSTRAPRTSWPKPLRLLSRRRAIAIDLIRLKRLRKSIKQAGSRRTESSSSCQLPRAQQTGQDSHSHVAMAAATFWSSRCTGISAICKQPSCLDSVIIWACGCRASFAMNMADSKASWLTNTAWAMRDLDALGPFQGKAFRLDAAFCIGSLHLSSNCI